MREFAHKSLLSPQLAACLALIAAQLGTGLPLSLSNPENIHEIFPTSNSVLAEFIKFSLSTALFYREWRSRTKYRQIPDAEAFLDEDSEPGEESKVQETTSTELPSVGGFVHTIRDELPTDSIFGLAQLALFYSVVNNLTLYLCQLIDQKSTYLLQAGTTLITAVLLIILLRAAFSSRQWTAILVLSSGTLLATYPQGMQTSTTSSVFSLILVQMILAALASIYHQTLSQTSESSLHVMNMVLFSTSTIIGAVLKLVLFVVSPKDTKVFAGFASLNSALLALSSVVVGLALTAVYKYADALVKCFATALFAAVFIGVSTPSILEGHAVAIIPGAIFIFISTWLYTVRSAVVYETAVPSSPATSQTEQDNRSFISKCVHAILPSGAFRKVGLLISTFFTIVLVSILSVKKAEIVAVTAASQLNATTTPEVWRSPMANTMAIVRLNPYLPVRLPVLETKYAPFFHTVHISMAEHDVDRNLQEPKRDYWDDHYYTYKSVANTMRMIQNDPNSTINGVLYFHFDAWIEPMGFYDMDFERIWVTWDRDYTCMGPEPYRNPGWVWFNGGGLENTLLANKAATKLDRNFTFNPDKFCQGWSDIYYIPRRFFSDFIALADTFAEFPVFHEIAVPTMTHIIENTYTREPEESVLYKWADCWGGCCVAGPHPDELDTRRCGHKFDFRDWDVARVHFDKLDEYAKLLDTPKPELLMAHPKMLK